MVFVTNLINPAFRQVAIKGNNKILYKTEEKGVFTMSFEEDDEDIAILRSKITQLLFSLLSDCSISNHFISIAGLKELKVRALEPLPFIFKVYSFTNEELSKRLFCSSNIKLKKYLNEIHMKNTPSESLISKDHVLTFGWLTLQEMEKMTLIANRVMDIFYGFFKAIGITITALNLEFGKVYESGKISDILIIDELSPKTMNFYIEGKLKASVQEACIEFSKRLGILKYD